MRGLLQAATSDNVQPLALHACEELGTRLPVLNTATRIKIERLAARNQNQTLKFVKAQVGFCAGDSADMLGKTDSGLSFLCLAAVLVSWGQGMQAAKLLENLVRQHPKDEQPLPTLLQLNDVLRALKPKLADSGLTRDVVGCHDWCSSFLQPVSNDMGIVNFVSTPGAAGVQHLLDAFNQCFRLGDDSCTVRVDAWGTCLPWVIAVTKWLLGDFPNMWLLDGSHFIKSSLPKVSVFEADGRSCSKVSISRRLNSLDQLISTSETRESASINGMLNAQLWTKFQLLKLALPKSLCAQMLYFVTKYLVPKVILCQRMEEMVQRTDGADIDELLPSAFPDQTTRLAAMQYLLGENVVLPNEDPDFKILSDDITKAYRCSRCKCLVEGVDPSQDRDVEFQYRHRHHRFTKPCLEVSLGILAADLLSLTIFASEYQTRRFPMLSCSPQVGFRKSDSEGIDVIEGAIGRTHSWQGLITHGWRRIMMQELHFLSCNSRAIFEHALELTGSSSESETILSSANGQVIYPSILDTGALRENAYLQLSYTSGCLMWDGLVLGALVSNGVSVQCPSSWAQDVALRPTSPATKVEYSPRQNFVQTKTMSLTLGDLQHAGWQYSLNTKAWFPNMGPATAATRNGFNFKVWDLIDGISQTIFSHPCDHKHDSPAGALGDHFIFVEPDWFGSYKVGDQSLLIDHRGNSMWQIQRLAMAWECCVLHREGCISCALAVAKRLNIKMVVC
ncbi:hypothetical protein IMSHALPRED_005094 [Imshaugia aleurites]|uniref:Uncharacterized protein n=1 Tax=Imshaugia aleurites TaxID=172621 RepID=A0A8H3IPF8_9LECA|nr:hypothetical protein IMSHALPRED_005094 [Imshaugia aleurites]